jgi:copper chaperone CopZ
MKPAGLRYRGMKQLTPTVPEAVHVTTLEILGVSCDTCVRDVTTALNALDGIVHVQVDLESNTGIVEHLPSYSDAAALVAAVRRAGYAARVERTVDKTVPAAPLAALGCGCGCCASPQPLRPGTAPLQSHDGLR